MGLQKAGVEGSPGAANRFRVLKLKDPSPAAMEVLNAIIDVSSYTLIENLSQTMPLQSAVDIEHMCHR